MTELRLKYPCYGTQKSQLRLDETVIVISQQLRECVDRQHLTRSLPLPCPVALTANSIDVLLRVPPCAVEGQGATAAHTGCHLFVQRHLKRDTKFLFLTSIRLTSAVVVGYMCWCRSKAIPALITSSLESNFMNNYDTLQNRQLGVIQLRVPDYLPL